MNPKDQDTNRTTGERAGQPGDPEGTVSDGTVSEGGGVFEYEVTEYHSHTHTTMASELGKSPECREALDRLYHYLDGELTESRRREIKEHLDTCMPCLEAFDFEAELKMLIARRCRDEVPAHLRLRVVQALSEASVSDERDGGSGEGAK